MMPSVSPRRLTAPSEKIAEIWKIWLVGAQIEKFGEINTKKNCMPAEKKSKIAFGECKFQLATFS
jgi:hypothetical protein